MIQIEIAINIKFGPWLFEFDSPGLDPSITCYSMSSLDFMAWSQSTCEWESCLHLPASLTCTVDHCIHRHAAAVNVSIQVLLFILIDNKCRGTGVLLVLSACVAWAKNECHSLSFLLNSLAPKNLTDLPVHTYQSPTLYNVLLKTKQASVYESFL